jgi:hypothetical protein
MSVKRFFISSSFSTAEMASARSLPDDTSGDPGQKSCEIGQNLDIRSAATSISGPS